MKVTFNDAAFTFVGVALGIAISYFYSLYRFYLADKRFQKMIKDRTFEDGTNNPVLDRNIPQCTKDPNTCEVAFCNFAKCLNDENNTKENL